MKSVFLFIICAATHSFAMSGKVPPVNNHTGREQCAFYDAGKTEEHSPHNSMEECRAKHSNCEMRCFVYQDVCQTEGVRVINLTRADGSIDRHEETRTYDGISTDEWRAREMANQKCRMDYPYNDFCRDLNCHEDSTRTR